MNCAECEKPRETCSECGRGIATEHDEGNHNTGACGCEVARLLCWRTWNGQCLPLSVYDPDFPHDTATIGPLSGSKVSA